MTMRLKITGAAILVALAAAGDSQAQSCPVGMSPRDCIALLMQPRYEAPPPSHYEQQRRLQQLEQQQRDQQRQLDVLRGQQGPISTNPCLAQPGVWRC